MAARSERREALRQALAAQLGEDEAATLMEQLPPFDWSRLATKDDLARLEGGIDERFVAMDERFRSLDHRLDERFVGIDERFVGIDERFVGLERRFDDRLGDLANRIDDRFDAFQRFSILLVVSTVLATAAAVAGAVVAGASI